MILRSVEELKETIAFNRMRGASTLVSLDELKQLIAAKQIADSFLTYKKSGDFGLAGWVEIHVDPKLVWIPHGCRVEEDLSINSDIRKFEFDGYWLFPIVTPVCNWVYHDHLIRNPGYIEYTEYDTITT